MPINLSNNDSNIDNYINNFKRKSSGKFIVTSKEMDGVLDDFEKNVWSSNVKDQVGYYWSSPNVERASDFNLWKGKPVFIKDVSFDSFEELSTKKYVLLGVDYSVNSYSSLAIPGHNGYTPGSILTVKPYIAKLDDNRRVKVQEFKNKDFKLYKAEQTTHLQRIIPSRQPAPSGGLIAFAFGAMLFGG